MNLSCISIYKMRSYIFIFIFFIIFGCQTGDDKEIPMEQFAKIYIEVLLKEKINITSDSVYFQRNINTDSLLYSYKLDKQKIKNTIIAYNKDVKKWKNFYQIVIKRLEELQKENISH